jgi:hypothetical protein
VSPAGHQRLQDPPARDLAAGCRRAITPPVLPARRTLAAHTAGQPSATRRLADDIAPKPPAAPNPSLRPPLSNTLVPVKRRRPTQPPRHRQPLRLGARPHPPPAVAARGAARPAGRARPRPRRPGHARGGAGGAGAPLGARGAGQRAGPRRHRPPAPGQAGERNNLLWEAARNLYNLVATGALDAREVEAGLLKAADRCGLLADEPRQTAAPSPLPARSAWSTRAGHPSAPAAPSLPTPMLRRPPPGRRANAPPPQKGGDAKANATAPGRLVRPPGGTARGW